MYFYFVSGSIQSRWLCGKLHKNKIEFQLYDAAMNAPTTLQEKINTSATGYE